MALRIITLSGPIASGKSTMVDGMKQRSSFEHIMTSTLMRKLFPGTADDRGELHKLADRLEAKTGGAWLAEALADAVKGRTDGVVIVDSVRTAAQLEAIRKRFPGQVTHLHTTASTGELKRRYDLRDKPMDRGKTFEEARNAPQEQAIERLAKHADITLMQDGKSPEQVATEAILRLKLTPPRANRTRPLRRRKMALPRP
ncbi:MAG: hypothetical protein Alpg2KO_26680 [Alphaproteobacteria bacterium]